MDSVNKLGRPLFSSTYEHGGFQPYPHKIRKARSPASVFCNGTVDGADYPFLFYGRWDVTRQQLYLSIRKLSLDSIVREIRRSADSYALLSDSSGCKVRSVEESRSTNSSFSPLSPSLLVK